HVVIVHAQVAAMTLEMGFRERVVEERVVFELRQLDLLRVEVDGLLEQPERFIFVEHANGYEVAHLQKETLDLLAETRPRFADLPVEQHHLLLAGKQSQHFAEALAWISREFGESAREGLDGMESFEEDDVVNGKREQILGASPEVGDAVAYGGVDDRIAIQLVR